MLPLEPLRIRAFRDLWLGQAISQLGDSLYYVIFMFMVQKVTDSFAMVGYVGALETAPYLLFSPYAGVLADRFDRRRIMLATDLACGAMLALFAVSVWFDPKPHFALIGGVAFALSSVRVFFWPAKNAAIPCLVPAETLMKANALSAMTQNVMYLAGLGFSASVLAALYALSPGGFFVAAFAINAISFLVSAWFVAKLPPIVPEQEAGDSKNPLADVKEGVAYIGRRHELKVLLGLQMLLTLFISPFFPVYVATNEQWFGGKPGTLLWFEFSFFLGYVVGTTIVGRSNLTRPGQGFIWGLAAVGGCVAAMAYSPNFWLFVLWNLVAGVALPFANIPVMTYLQITVPDAYRGRVNSALTMMSVGIQPIGLGLSGQMLQRFGLVTGFLIMGSGMAGAALLGLLDGPFRRLRIPKSEDPAPVVGAIEPERGTVEAVPTGQA